MLRVFWQGDGMVADNWRENAVSNEIVKFFQQFVLERDRYGFAIFREETERFL